MAARNLVGALYTGPGNDAPTTATIAHQIEAFSQRTKTDWYAKLEEKEIESRERTTAEEKSQFIRWCEQSTMEKGLTQTATKKRSWVKASFHVEGGDLYRNLSKSYSHYRKVISLPELFETITEATAATSTLDEIQVTDNKYENKRKRPRFSSESNLNSSMVTKKSFRRTSKNKERTEIFAKLADSHMEIAGLLGRLRDLEPKDEDEDDD
ncbi:MAG: hypothetical protein Q9221_008183 [Calogaya cf. arnoldii]